MLLNTAVPCSRIVLKDLTLSTIRGDCPLWLDDHLLWSGDERKCQVFKKKVIQMVLVGIIIAVAS